MHRTYHPDDERIHDELLVGAPVEHMRSLSTHLHWLRCEDRSRRATQRAARTWSTR